MAPKRTTRSTPVTPTPNATTTTTVTEAQLQALIDQGVAAAMAEAEASRVRNGHDSNGQALWESLDSLDGFEKKESTTTPDSSSAMPWATLKKIMTDKYYLRGEIKKIEIEMKFPEEVDKIEKYIGGLPDMILGSVKASKPKTMQEAIEIVEADLQMIHTTANNNNNNQKGNGCYECEAQGHFKRNCPKLKNNDRGNQAGNDRAPAKDKRSLCVSVMIVRILSWGYEAGGVGMERGRVKLVAEMIQNELAVRVVTWRAGCYLTGGGMEGLEWEWRACEMGFAMGPAGEGRWGGRGDGEDRIKVSRRVGVLRRGQDRRGGGQGCRVPIGLGWVGVGELAAREEGGVRVVWRYCVAGGVSREESLADRMFCIEWMGMRCVALGRGGRSGEGADVSVSDVGFVVESGNIAGSTSKYSGSEGYGRCRRGYRAGPRVEVWWSSGGSAEFIVRSGSFLSPYGAVCVVMFLEHGHPYRLAPSEMIGVMEQLIRAVPKKLYKTSSSPGRFGLVFQKKDDHSDAAWFSKIGKPMTKLTQKKVKFVWGDKEEAAFQLLKQKLCSAPILALPEGSEDFITYCDASKKGLGDVLMQREKTEAGYQGVEEHNGCGWRLGGCLIAILGRVLGLPFAISSSSRKHSYHAASRRTIEALYGRNVSFTSRASWEEGALVVLEHKFHNTFHGSSNFVKESWIGEVKRFVKRSKISISQGLRRNSQAIEVPKFSWLDAYQDQSGKEIPTYIRKE
ncbi:putative reverse transcriptase domain-containing protein [Tanacetum coccineum]